MVEKDSRSFTTGKITVAGGGYVGLSLACLLSKEHDITLLDTDGVKVDMINGGVSPMKDEGVERRLAEEDCRISATADEESAFSGAAVVFIAVPTDFDEAAGTLGTDAAERAASKAAELSPDALIVIKSTVPVGFTERMRKRTGARVLFCPEFLRENRALKDCSAPQRIVIGTDTEDEEMKKAAEELAELITGCTENDPPVLIMGSSEAEAVKLFSNTYLALRVAFFNELDSFAESRGLDTSGIIEGVCLDSRIGKDYNNPGFGYGGCCLPKDTRQLLSDFGDIPQSVMSAAGESNAARKAFVAERAFGLARERAENKDDITIGVYRMTMKAGSDNFRQSAVWEILDILKGKGARVIVFEPLMEAGSVPEGTILESDLEGFKKKCDVIIANRYDSCLDDVLGKVYTRDIFRRD